MVLAIIFKYFCFYWNVIQLFDQSPSQEKKREKKKEKNRETV